MNTANNFYKALLAFVGLLVLVGIIGGIGPAFIKTEYSRDLELANGHCIEQTFKLNPSQVETLDAYGVRIKRQGGDSVDALNEFLRDNPAIRPAWKNNCMG